MIYVVCGIHTKQLQDRMNIQSIMMVFEAVSTDEATGKYVVYANNKLPEHGLFQRPLIMSLDEVQSIRGLKNV